MIGRLVLALAGAWLAIAFKLARWLGTRSRRPAVSMLVTVIAFAALAALPFADELAGRWQFARLCQAEAVAWAGPGATQVTAAGSESTFSTRKGFVFTIQQESVRYTDVSSGQVFYTMVGFSTPGGALMRLGLNLGNSTSCWPDHRDGQLHGVDLAALLQRGRE